MSREFDRSLTEGPIPAAIWTLAWPTMLQNLVAGLQGLVDHVMVGRYVGFEANAAIGVSWQIFLVVVVFISSLYSGMGVLVARFAGANNPAKVARVVYQVFVLSAIIGIFGFAPVGYFAAPHLLDLANAAPEVQAEALPYLRTLFVFSIGNMYFFMIGGALRAAGDAKTPLRLGVALTVLNIALNVILIRGAGPIPAFGTQGAAMGTVIAGLVVSGWAIWLLFSGKLVIDLRPAITWRPDTQVISRVFRFGLPTGFQGIAMNIGGVILVRYVGSLEHSAEAQAAYSVGYGQIFSLITWTSVALMAAAATVAGQSLGAERPERASQVPQIAAMVGLWVSIPVGVLFLTVPDAMLGLFGIEQREVLDLGGQLLAFLALSGVFLTAALSYTGALQGTGDTRSPMYISIISQLILPLAICAALDVIRADGLIPADIWLAIVIGHFTRCTLSMLRFQQGKWQAIEVELGEAQGP
ncbi:MAG: MATE family efflux transporter [Holophagales bacterium]|nr:MATE family efflux transporter [Holophagales bacterium]